MFYIFIFLFFENKQLHFLAVSLRRLKEEDDGGGEEEIVKGQMQRERGKEGNVNVDLISKFAGLSSTEKKKRQLNKSYRQLHMKCAAFVSMSPNQKATRVETFRP